MLMLVGCHAPPSELHVQSPEPPPVSSPAPEPLCSVTVEVEIDGALPIGEWEGPGFTVDNTGQSFAPVRWHISVLEDLILGDFVGGGYLGWTAEQFDFGPDGVATWSDPQGVVLGDCTASGGRLWCEAPETADRPGGDATWTFGEECLRLDRRVVFRGIEQWSHLALTRVDE
jgi:hypothetical protein